jgi:valyl-tRNA synthetase
MAHPYPEPDAALVDEDAEAAVGRAIEAVQELRGWRDRVGAAPGATVPARLEASGYERTADHIARLARVDFAAGDGEPVATVAVPGGTIAVLASDAVDPDAEARRREARVAVLRKEISRAESKLANQGFVAKAPEHVVQAERDKLAALRQELEELGG